MSRQNWARIPPWCMNIHDEESAPRARAFVYLLCAWHNGDDPSTREFRRVTGFGGGRADKVFEEIARWALANDAAIPDRVAGQYRGTSGAEAGHLDAAAIGTIAGTRGSSGAETGQKRGAHARDLLPEREREEEEGGIARTREAAPASAPSPAPPPPRLVHSVPPAPDRPVEATVVRPRQADPEEDTSPVVIEGKTLPGNLPAFLDGMPNRMRVEGKLIRAGFGTTRRLLALAPGRLRYQGYGLNDADEQDVETCIRRWGVEPGCLSTGPPNPATGPPPRAAPPRADRTTRALAALGRLAYPNPPE